MRKKTRRGILEKCCYRAVSSRVDVDHASAGGHWQCENKSEDISSFNVIFLQLVAKLMALAHEQTIYNRLVDLEFLHVI